MAIAFVQNQGTNTSTTVGATTMTLAPAANATAGHLVALVAAAGGGKTVTGVTDTKGSMWLVDVVATSGSATVGVCTTLQNGGALTTGDVITMTFSGTGANKCCAAMEFSGIASGVRFDQLGTATGTTTTSPSVATSNPTTQADELVIGGFSWAAAATRTFTAGGSFAKLEADVGSGAFLSCAIEYLIVAATGTQTASGTLSAAPTSVAETVATYKGIAVASTAAQPVPFLANTELAQVH